MTLLKKFSEPTETKLKKAASALSKKLWENPFGSNFMQTLQLKYHFISSNLVLVFRVVAHIVPCGNEEVGGAERYSVDPSH